MADMAAGINISHRTYKWDITKLHRSMSMENTLPTKFYTKQNNSSLTTC